MVVNKNRWRLVVTLGGMLSLPLQAAIAASQSTSVTEVLAALGKGPTLGSTSAPVTIVEFADFQCSFCKKFWADTLPQLKETYVNRGQVRFTYRHLAILGKFSEHAAQAAECAGEQGKFWEYHNKLFSNQGGLAFTNPKLKQYAQELKLNHRMFGRCLDSGQYGQKVEGETAVAMSLGARGTPTFFVNNGLVVGAQPFEVFRAAVEDLKAAALKAKQRK